MTQWLAGMRITAGRLNDSTPVAVTGTVTPATGFSVSSFDAQKSGGITQWTVILIRTGGTITADAGGNIIDAACCTMPANCRPGPMTYNAVYEKAGQATGSIRILPDGSCTLTTLSTGASITSGNTINFSGTFVTG